MNRDQFISYLENPATLSAETTTQLQGVIKEFPWFQTAQLLYVKNLHNQNSIHYGNQLKIAAAYTSDRTVLYELIGGRSELRKKESRIKNQEVAVKKEVSLIQQPVTSDQKQETTKVLDEVQEFKLKTQESLLKAQELLLESQESLLKTQEIRIKAQEVTLKTLVETEVDKKEKEKEKQKQSEGTVVEKKKEENIIPVFEDVEKAKTDMASLNQDILGEAVNASIGLEVTDVTSTTETAGEVQEEEDLIDKSGTHSFNEWLKLMSKGTSKAEKEKIVLSQLIDKFIVEQPSITRKAEFYSPVDRARESVKENEELVTETLARIFEQQGNYAKAIKAYEKLILKYPGKSAFFATRIKEIREKQ